MKKIILTYFILFVAVCDAQIIILDNESSQQGKAENITVRYDSLYNEPSSWQECQSMIGQSIVVCPKSKSLQNLGYRGFYNLDKRVYCPTISKIYSNYDSLNCRRFKILDASIKYYLTIADDRDTLLYKWLDDGRRYLFITEGYVEKQNKLFANKKFVYKGANTKVDDPISKNQIDLRPGNIFIFDKIVILPKNNPDISICALLKTSNNTAHVAIPVTLIGETFISKDKIDKYAAKYGRYWVDIAMSNQIKVGMPSELVKFSWGNPNSINKNSYGIDQWCYNGQYVYIKGGKVSAWN